jgi:hypothetical protein
LGAFLLSLFVAFEANAQTPLDDPLGGTYLGHQLGLYRNGNNQVPEQHRIEGLTRASSLVPLDINGAPNPNGRIVLMSLGMSNAMIPFCDSYMTLPVEHDFVDPTQIRCQAWTFMGRSRTFAAFDNARVQLVNGAYLGQSAAGWADENEPEFTAIPPDPMAPIVDGNYDRLETFVFPEYTPPVGAAQIQVVWLKLVNGTPPHGLPGPGSDAELLIERTGRVLRLLKMRFPNVQIVFLTSGTYRGWSTSIFNPEPQSYEGGLAMKWLIEAQINQMETGTVDPVAGDLDYSTGIAPWIVWGPYLWADAQARNSDGMSWNFFEYAPDYVHHDGPGLSKFGMMLLHFFTFNRFSHCWFTGEGTCE